MGERTRGVIAVWQRYAHKHCRYLNAERSCTLVSAITKKLYMQRDLSSSSPPFPKLRNVRHVPGNVKSNEAHEFSRRPEVQRSGGQRLRCGRR